MGKDDPIRFRAFITDLQQRANPQYNAKQYIGRIEKFITYTGVQREISFTLNIIAFSKDEIDGVWTRINYLTGLVFPYGFNKGIMQPNITRLTIGNVYDNQPGYITALDTNFKDLSESWDIDRDVPIAATMRMSFTLIEKATKIATSPFYGITEQNGNFNQEIPTAGKNATSTAATSTAAPTTTDAPATPTDAAVITVPIEKQSANTPQQLDPYYVEGQRAPFAGAGAANMYTDRNMSLPEYVTSRRR